MKLPKCFLAFVLLSGASIFAAQPLTRGEEDLPRVAAVDLAQLNVSDFTDEELDLPYYLAHFHQLANSIESHGPERGYIRISVWRGGTAAPHNARVMENILSLAYWYCLDRPWNPYRGDPALRARLEAALEFWCGSQNSDGRFSEYEPGRWGLAPTAFATKFMGEALVLLQSGPPIDPAIHARTIEANRRAIHATLTHPELYEHGKGYTNQFGNVWGGGLAHLSVHPDAELRALWEKRFHGSREDFQSPAGYYYERNGPDFGYTTSTHDHNSRQAWEWLRGTKTGDALVEKERAWFEWLATNVVPEPDGSGWIYNRAIETRQRHPSFRHYDSPLGEFIPLVRAFAESREERVARLRQERAALAASWPAVRPMPDGDFWAYSPYAFLHRRLSEWRPTTAERDAAHKLVPVLASEQFTRQFADSRRAVVFTYIRRPSYYAAFNSGEKISDQQRYGLGLIWTPALGAVVQSQTGSDTAAWGTRAAGAASVYENASLPARFVAPAEPLVSGARAGERSALRELRATPGVHDLPDGQIAAHYPLGDRGEKTAKFTETGVSVAVQHAGEFTETLPLLVPLEGKIQLAADHVTLTSPRGDFVVRFGDGVAATVDETPTRVLTKRLVVLTLRATDSLAYTLHAGSPPP